MKYGHDGYFEMRLRIAAEYVYHAGEQAERCECFEAAEYIQGVLRRALAQDVATTGKENRELAAVHPLLFINTDWFGC